MKVNISIDLGSVALGIGVGLLLAPFIFSDTKSLKKTAVKGAIKEVTSPVRNLFKRKDKEET